MIELGKWNGTDGCIRIILLESGVSDEGADVLLKLSQVLDNVVLSEHNTVVVAHLRGHRKEELAALEEFDHDLDVFLDLAEHLLCCFCLIVAKDIAMLTISLVTYFRSISYS